MKDDSALKILKEAILLEQRGQAFYQKVADQSEQADVKAFFKAMAEEEKRHIAILSDQFKAYQAESRFVPTNQNTASDHSVAMQVLGEKMQKRISAAAFEAAAVSAAMAMEERAVKLYSQRAAASTDDAEKALYEWLAEWEKGHFRLLSQIDQDLKEAIWFDRNFWPF